MIKEKIKQIDFFIRRHYYNKIFEIIEKETIDCNTLVDLGCGYNTVMKRITKRMTHSTGVDLFEISVQKSKRDGIHDEYILSDVMEFLKNQPENSFDVVISMSLIEHYPKKQGVELMKLMERTAAKKAIIFTPNGYVPQRPYENNPWQEHKSGWTTNEMRSYGYEVYGFSGYKKLKGERSKIKFAPRPFWKALSYITNYFIYRRPEYAFEILCIKKII